MAGKGFGPLGKMKELADAFKKAQEVQAGAQQLQTELEQMEIEGLKFSPYNYETRISKFDLTLFAEEVKGNIRFELEYSTDIFKKETIERSK